MTKKTFFHSTLRDVKLYIDAFYMEKDYQSKCIEHQSWLTGAYVMNAAVAAFNKKTKYPENPLLENAKTIKEIAKNNNKSEEEMNQELLYMTLRVRQINAKLEKS